MFVAVFDMAPALCGKLGANDRVPEVWRMPVEPPDGVLYRAHSTLSCAWWAADADGQPVVAVWAGGTRIDYFLPLASRADAQIAAAARKLAAQPGAITKAAR